MSPVESSLLAVGEVRVATTHDADRRARRRAFWLLLAAFVLAVLVDFWFGTARDAGGAPASSWSSEAHGFLALHELLTGLGYDVDRQRASYGQLPDPAASVLLRLAPLSTARLRELVAVDSSQRRKLREWLEEGGWVLTTTTAIPQVSVHGFDLLSSPRLVADRGDTLLSGAIGGPIPHTAWDDPSGAVVARRDAIAPESMPRPLDDRTARIVSAYVARDPLGVETFGADPGGGWRPLLVAGDRALAVEREVGRGRVWAFASPLAFSNYGLGALDWAPLVVAVLHAASDGGRRRLCFDEYCHGLIVRKGGLWFVTHGPLFYPVVGLLALLALLGWRAAVRFGSPLPARLTARRAVEEYVVSFADLARRSRQYRGAAERIIGAERLRHPECASTLEPMLDSIRGARTFAAEDLARVDATVRRAVHRQHESDQ